MEKILKILEDHARYTIEELSGMLNMSEAEVTAEIKRLEKEGIICGYKTIIDWDKVSTDRVTALIEIKVTPQKTAGFEEIAETIMVMPEVESVYLMSGGYDFCVIVKGHTFKEVAMFVAKRLAPMNNVISTATHFVLRRYKDLGTPLTGNQKDDRGMLAL
ncbi:MAG: Lrp/AsnC family transcriptional regulator [Clostridia bacterium]|nr:Lrp/AsnC family transcriptional regulator [Clostridia bacterium]